ncbi:MAG: hypothetical protein ACQEQF_00685 [Bacillota bacterium]
MAQGVVFPSNNLSEYQNRQDTPIGDFNYWIDMLLREDGEGILENLMSYQPTAEQIINNEVAMFIIMEGKPVSSGEKTKVTLWSGKMTSSTDDMYTTVYTVPIGKQVIITDFIVHGTTTQTKLAINEQDITDFIHLTVENPNEQIYLYHKADEGDEIQIYDQHDNNSSEIIGYIQDK